MQGELSNFLRFLVKATGIWLCQRVARDKDRESM